MKNFLIGFLLAVVGCLISLATLIAYLHVDFKEFEKERKNRTYSPSCDRYPDYGKYGQHKENEHKYSDGTMDI